MTKAERKIIDFVRDYAAVIIFVLATAAGVFLRVTGLDF